MITQTDRDFINQLFDNLLTHVDLEMIDLGGDDSCCDHIEWEQLTLEITP